tara:strand:+ start:8476 stop:10131 length:1656 start_codon:yes stop_codon:yes gene_type:complete
VAIHSRRQAVKRTPPVAKANTVIAPIGGIDATTILSSGDPLFSIYSINLLPAEFGLQVRKGYREWQINLDNGAGISVNTMIPFGGLDDDATDDRLFAVTNEGIWDVTIAEAAPSLEVTFADQTAEAGYGVFVHTTTIAQEELVFYADSKNGLHQYSAGTGLWTIPAITGTGAPSPAEDLVIGNVNFITSHNGRLWLIEENKSKAWYLAVDAVAGAADEFFFGPKMPHGGNLAGLFPWTIDSGTGIDDYLVAVGRAGDILPYRGTDPGSADGWELSGKWFIGAIPKGPKIATQDGGDLNILSAYGLTSMNELVVGTDGKNAAAADETKKISLLIKNAMEQSRTDDGWDVSMVKGVSSMIITQPQLDNGNYVQFVRHTTTQGWGLWRQVPISGFDEWQGKVYFGTKDLRIAVMDVPVDNLLITPTAPINGDSIDFSILTSYQDFGEPGLHKRGKYARPYFLSISAPASTTKFRYDYDLREVLNVGADPATTGSEWDVGMWDDALWGTSELTAKAPVSGGAGMGRNMALSMSGASRVETTLISWDVVWDSGAPL